MYVCRSLSTFLVVLPFDTVISVKNDHFVLPRHLTKFDQFSYFTVVVSYEKTSKRKEKQKEIEYKNV
uniref:Secreted protein n=1 Tax=Caenorhabditis tropicalis TaxID=1561998 RepID=A0A1I7TKN8_9PELO